MRSRTFSRPTTTPRRATGHGARAAMLVLVALSLGACGKGPARDTTEPGDRSALLQSPPDTPPDIAGIVTAVQPGDSIVRKSGGGDSPNGSVSCPPSCDSSGTPLRSVRIEETPGTATGGQKAVVTVLQDAVVLRRTPSGTTKASFGAIQAGQRVAAWFTGPVMESYPVRAQARLIVIEP